MHTHKHTYAHTQTRIAGELLDKSGKYEYTKSGRPLIKFFEEAKDDDIGKLTCGEWKERFDACPPQNYDGQELAHGIFENLSHDDLENLYKACDKDGNGALDPQEFAQGIFGKYPRWFSNVDGTFNQLVKTTWEGIYAEEPPEPYDRIILEDGLIKMSFLLNGHGLVDDGKVNYKGFGWCPVKLVKLLLQSSLKAEVCLLKRINSQTLSLSLSHTHTHTHATN
jgi:hypothetical protein